MGFCSKILINAKAMRFRASVHVAALNSESQNHIHVEHKIGIIQGSISYSLEVGNDIFKFICFIFIFH